MFRPLFPAHLPTKRQLRAEQLQSICRAHPVTPSMGAALGMPKHIFDRIAKLWENFQGPVERLDKFTLEVEIHEARAGYVWGFVQYYKGRVNLGVIVEPHDEDKDELIYEAFDGDPPMNDMKFSASLWDLTPVVETIRRKKGKKDCRPNDPCWCGSEKKFKRCCGGRA